jgi:hypothetical protein
MPEDKICPVCRVSFTLPPTRQKQKYCSRECSVIGRKTTNEETAKERVNDFIESLPDIQIYDVLEGDIRLKTNTDNYLNAKGVRAWNDGKKKFKVIVYE